MKSCRSVHNVRIECLWVDVTAQVGATWADIFVMLELHHGLDINNVNHIWLFHHLFLSTINSVLAFFAQSWNKHRIQIRRGPNRSPADMFGFDMLVHGVRGDPLPNDNLEDEELEVYGIDWEALRDDRLLQSQQANNASTEGSTSWINQAGPPEHLNEVQVDSPGAPLHQEEIQYIDDAVLGFIELSDNNSVAQMWIISLSIAQDIRPDLF